MPRVPTYRARRLPSTKVAPYLSPSLAKTGAPEMWASVGNVGRAVSLYGRQLAAIDFEFQRQANRTELADLNYQRDMRMLEAEKEMLATSNPGEREQLYESALIDIKELAKQGTNQAVQQGYVQDLLRKLPQYKAQYNDSQRRLTIANIEASAERDIERALESGDKDLFADAMNRRLQNGTIVKEVYDNEMEDFYTDSLEFQVGRALKNGDYNAAYRALEQTRQNEGIDKNTWHGLKRLVDEQHDAKVKQEKAKAHNALLEVQQQTEKQAFDMLRAGELTPEWLLEQRETGAMSESRYQTYMKAITRTTGELHYDYDYWEAIYNAIDAVHDGAYTPEDIDNIRQAISKGANVAYTMDDAQQLRKALDTAMEQDEPVNETAKLYIDELKRLRSAGALATGIKDPAERAKANSLAFLKKRAALDAILQAEQAAAAAKSQPINLTKIDAAFEALISVEKKHWTDWFFLDWIFHSPEETARYRQGLTVFIGPIGKRLAPHFQKEDIATFRAKRKRSTADIITELSKE